MPLHFPRAFAAISIALLSVSTLVQAQSEPDTGNISRPLWEAGVAGIGARSPAYPGASDAVSRAIPLPWAVYRGSVFRADGSNFGARVAKTRDIEFDIGIAGALSASSADVSVRQGMPDLGYLIEFGPRVRINLARPTSDSLLRLDLPLRGVFELDNGLKHRGMAFEPRLTFDKRDIGAGWGVTSSASLYFGDRRFNEHLYGVAAAFATPTRSAYEAKSGLVTPRVHLGFSRKLTNDIRLFVSTRIDFAGSGVNSDSPLHVKDSGVSFGLGLIWTLWQSKEQVVD